MAVGAPRKTYPRQARYCRRTCLVRRVSAETRPVPLARVTGCQDHRLCRCAGGRANVVPRVGGFSVTIEKKTAEQQVRLGPRPKLGLSALIGCGDRIGAF